MERRVENVGDYSCSGNEDVSRQLSDYTRSCFSGSEPSLRELRSTSAKIARHRDAQMWCRQMSKFESIGARRPATRSGWHGRRARSDIVATVLRELDCADLVNLLVSPVCGPEADEQLNLWRVHDMGSVHSVSKCCHTFS